MVFGDLPTCIALHSKGRKKLTKKKKIQPCQLDKPAQFKDSSLIFWPQSLTQWIDRDY